MITCETKLFWNSFEIISVFYFTHNHRRWLRVENKLLKWFQSYIIFISHVTSSETEIKLFQPPK